MTLPRGWVLAVLPDLVGPNGLIADGDWVESKDQDVAGSIRLTQLADIGDEPVRAEGTVIAVKPGDVPGACRAVADGRYR